MAHAANGYEMVSRHLLVGYVFPMMRLGRLRHTASLAPPPGTGERFAPGDAVIGAVKPVCHGVSCGWRARKNPGPDARGATPL
ncbi:MAG: hypothetical protein F4148_15325 [Caldilineaceae bacterium SB0675_bin_29]|uniref:Uncharacterized protein n=1 Tax=Caldilineaceae bacterium SB0675_bin_29 TaxID=2605266 RepID=A0A6B1G4R0_9CHLR|nr:hypothetical protein [Caldilineaceae bacterium SB0675_bin_29]